MYLGLIFCCTTKLIDCCSRRNGRKSVHNQILPQGSFQSCPMRYDRGETFDLDRVDVDRFSYFSIKYLVRGFLEYLDDGYSLWWKRLEECFDLGLKEILLDKYAMEVASYGIASRGG